MFRFSGLTRHGWFWLGAVLLLTAVTAMAGGPPGIYIEKSAIQRSHVDGSNVEEVVPGWKSDASGPFDIYQGPEGAYLYWFGFEFEDTWGNSFLARSNLDGGNIEEVIEWGGPLGGYHNFAIDAENAKIYLVYWGDTGGGSILRTDLDGSNFETLFNTTDAPRSLAIDAAGGKIYWSTAHDDTLRRANLDGSGEETLLTNVDSGSVALDLLAGRIYWATDTKIRRANLDGSEAEDIVTGLVKVYQLVLDPATDRMWWTDEYAGKIQTSDLIGVGVTDVVTDIPGPEGMGLVRATGGQSEERLYWLQVAPPEVPATSEKGLIVLALVVLAASSALLLRRRARSRSR